MLNQKEITVTMRRIDLCDLLIACTSAAERSGAEKWTRLHDELAAQLEAFDVAQGVQ